MKATAVTKAKKDQGACSKCGDALPAGSAYVWTQARYGPRIVRCTKFECRLRASDLTSSDKLARLYEVQEEMEDFVVDEGTVVSDVEDALQDWAERTREVAEEYEESASAIEDGFGHSTYQSDEIREKAEAAEEWASAIEGVSLPEEWDVDAVRAQAASEVEDASDEADVERQIEALIEEKRDEWSQEIVSILGDVSGELSV